MLIRLFYSILGSVLIAACGTPQAPRERSEVETEKVQETEQVQEVERVQLVENVSVVFYCQPTVERPDCDSKAYEAGGVLFGAIGAIIGLEAYEECAESRRLGYLDISLQVMNQFAEKINEHSADKLSSFNECAKDDDLTNLKTQYGAINIFDFKVEEWERIEVSKGWPNNVPSVLRARLLDLDKGEILWEGICSLPGSKLHSPGGSIVDVKKRLRLVAIECADKLAAPFVL